MYFSVRLINEKNLEYIYMLMFDIMTLSKVRKIDFFTMEMKYPDYRIVTKITSML